ncbi:uncharacterized protein HD556DRAFT_1426332 [Suillus plorans]|uniref:Uncharacterized protein n=1 Tax=Suillus plorans TaxID=116603 RepID=A0A9P7DAK2_9AGAM|nr:uncharacterized protein HD556DRAFT_1426332 [Suillus plorans]KAG1784711.1 hypothetical protein HD556DRAFT_1426332 [Suillus plorans]
MTLQTAGTAATLFGQDFLILGVANTLYYTRLVPCFRYGLAAERSYHSHTLHLYQVFFSPICHLLVIFLCYLFFVN